MENPLDVRLGSHLEFWLDRPMEFQWKIRWTLDWVPIWNVGWMVQWNSKGRSVESWNGFPFGYLAKKVRFLTFLAKFSQSNLT